MSQFCTRYANKGCTPYAKSLHFVCISCANLRNGHATTTSNTDSGCGLCGGAKLGRFCDRCAVGVHQLQALVFIALPAPFFFRAGQVFPTEPTGQDHNGDAKVYQGRYQFSVWHGRFLVTTWQIVWIVAGVAILLILSSFAGISLYFGLENWLDKRGRK